MPRECLKDLPADEASLIQALLDHYRIDKAKGNRWVMLWPQVEGHFSAPIPVAAAPLPTEDGRMSLETTTVQVMSVETESQSEPRRIVEQLEQNNGTIIESGEPPFPPSDMTALDDAILAVLAETDHPLKVSVIATRAKQEISSYFRSRVSNLVKRKMLVKLAENRYWLASRALPAR